jgi:hypothetical protein
MKPDSLSCDVGSQFITREFADALAGKQPAPYLRTHDPVQRMLAEHAAGTHGERPSKSAYVERMIHFWREVSLAGIPRAGRGMDECFALLFESAFNLAEAESEWAVEVLYDKTPAEWRLEAANDVWLRTPRVITHGSIKDAVATIYAPCREKDERWSNESTIAFAGEAWFWSGLACGAGIDENHRLWRLRVALGESSTNCWHDQRLHTQLIRAAALRADQTPQIQLMEHPLMRLIRIKYPSNPLEQQLMLRFLNMRCIEAGLESEEDAFCDPLMLSQWVRDARKWAEKLIIDEPQTYAGLLLEAGHQPLENCRQFYQTLLGNQIVGDSIDITIALMNWAKRTRGFEVSWYRAQLWEFIIHVVDAALWLGWLFPRQTNLNNKFDLNNGLGSAAA